MNTVSKRSMIIKVVLSDIDVSFEEVLKAIRQKKLEGPVTVTFSMDENVLVYEIEGQLPGFRTMPREKIKDMILGKI